MKMQCSGYVYHHLTRDISVLITISRPKYDQTFYCWSESNNDIHIYRVYVQLLLTRNIIYVDIPYPHIPIFWASPVTSDCLNPLKNCQPGSRRVATTCVCCGARSAAVCGSWERSSTRRRCISSRNCCRMQTIAVTGSLTFTIWLWLT